MTFKQSPNFNTGRNGHTVKRLVVHWIGAGTYESAVSWLTNPASQVSAHYVISGNRVTQLVKEEDTAWHAGNLTVNRESIGIEHDAIPNRPASEATYQTSGKLIAKLAKQYSIPLDRKHIIGHKEIKATACPGTMDIDKLITIAKGQGNNNTANTYKGYDLSNPESMKVAVDVLIRVQQGEFVDKPKYEALEKEANKLRTERDGSVYNFNRLCDVLQVQSNVDIALEELKKLINLEDIIVEKDKKLQEATTKINDLQVDIERIAKEHEKMQKSNTELSKKVTTQQKTIEDQGTKITNLSDQIDKIKEAQGHPILSGWRKILYELLIKQ